MQPRDRLVVPLDIADRAAALELARSLAPHVGLLKIGFEAFYAHGGDFVRAVQDCGVGVFLDLKMHDIPRTVEAGAKAIASLAPELLTVHAAGGADMVRAAKDAVGESTQVLAVTVLTSIDQASASELGLGQVAEVAHRFAGVALGAGADGVVCSAHELSALAELGGVRLVPGIRPTGSEAGDQRRVATPKEAIEAGATWLVVGRPILRAADPVAAAQAVVADIEGATSS